MNVIKAPHLPDKEAALFICDKKIKEKLHNIFLSYEDKNILNGISTHPDMTFCPLFDGDAVVSKDSFAYYSKLTEFGINIIKGENEICKNYPFDIAYNVVILNNKLFHNLKYTDKVILNYCKEKGIEPINVKQGYTKCSTLIIDEKSVITCDKKLNEIYRNNGIDSLIVSNDEILINNFDHGFIGGCGGKISKDTIGFFGDITKHKEFNKINGFLKDKKITFEILTKGPLFDYGSLIPVLHK